jgi:hypothetical protein
MNLPARRQGLWFVLGAVATLAAAQAWALDNMTPAQVESEGRACLVCHRMETIAYRDPETWLIEDLHIDGERFVRSNHGSLACTRCHATDYRAYPHRHSSSDEKLHCLGCHDDDPKLARFRFREVEAEFERSVHVQASPLPDGSGRKHRQLDCFSCHNPHLFRVARPGDSLESIVAEQNGVCISCHQRIADPATAGHLWLPNRALHWKAVRCIDCHTPISDLPSHEVLPADQGVRGCDDCHSKESVLLNQLYSYRAKREVEEQGLLSAALFNRSYVVGMSRSRTLDWAAVALLCLVLLGIAAHAVGRYRAYRSRQRNGAQA